MHDVSIQYVYMCSGNAVLNGRVIISPRMNRCIKVLFFLNE
jgi:hypothetical protein